MPGAAHLELLRLLEAQAWGGDPEVVLSRPAPGRGPAYLPVTGAPVARAEVLRLGAGVLADLATGLPDAPRAPARRPGAVVVDGLPVTAATLRAWPATRARRRRRVVLVTAAPDVALAEAWSRRTQAGAARPWRRFVRHWASRGMLPPATETGRLGRAWAAHVGAANVHVVGVEEAGSLVGMPPAAAVGLTSPAALSAAQVDVVRRVNAVLPFVVPPAELARRRRALVALASGGPRLTPPPLPAPLRTWAAEAGRRVAEEVRRSGCVVHGPLQVEPGPGTPLRRRDVLDELVRMIAAAALERAEGEAG